MDVLGNLSCCFDASKDIGETSVELVVCDCPLSKSCCLKWETATYAAAVIFSTADFFADVFGYVAFVDQIDDKHSLQTYLNVWLAFLIISGVIIVSEVALPIYSIVNLTGCGRGTNKSEEEVDKFRQTSKYWSRVNNILVILSEDGVIAIIRILIAFQSEAAVQDLQTTTGVVTSAIAFVVTILRHCLLILQIVTKFSRNNVMFSRKPPWDKGYCTKATCGLLALFFVSLFFSSCSLGLTGMSMAISAQWIDIHHDDNQDFLLNITLLAIGIPCAFILSVFFIIQTRW